MNQPKPMRAIVFIDGNNLYHGMQDKLSLSSLDLDYARFSRKLVGARQLIETRYYVGEVQQKGDLSRYQNQQRFLDKLANFERVSCHLGRLEPRPADASAKKLGRWLNALRRRPDVGISAQAVEELRSIVSGGVQWVEKAVDVMIAVDMVAMAYRDEYDVAYLVSADGDFTPAVEKVRDTGRKVFAASPLYGYKLGEAANTLIPLKRAFFDDCLG